MPAIHLGEMESRFADLIWRNAPLSSRRLAELAEEALSWKRTTTYTVEEALSWKRTTTYTVLKRLCDRGLFQNDGGTVQVLISREEFYTVLKRLCDRGLFQNDGGTVQVLISREEFYAMQSEQFVEETFDGSLPAFLAAFGSRKKLADADIQQLQKIIDDMRR